MNNFLKQIEGSKENNRSLQNNTNKRNIYSTGYDMKTKILNQFE
jgi:hypothetical protein